MKKVLAEIQVLEKKLASKVSYKIIYNPDSDGWGQQNSADTLDGVKKRIAEYHKRVIASEEVVVLELTGDLKEASSIDQWKKARKINPQVEVEVKVYLK